MAISLLDDSARLQVKDSDLDEVSGGDPGTVYTVRQIPPQINRELAKKHTERPINKRTGQRESVVDNVSLLDDLVDYALVDWSGILLKGEKAPCTRENKLLLDYQRKVALIGIAGLNQIAAEVRAESFRQPA
jgi:hypothetical protein